MNRSLVLICLLMVALAWFLLSYKITDVPPGINQDEASIGYNSNLITNTGYDENGRVFPLFVLTFGGDWKQPITIYATALTFKLFGPSYFNLRSVSVVFAIISTLIIFLLSKEIWGARWAMVTVGLFITTPIVVIQSHLALENIALVPFVLLWIWMLYHYQKFRKLSFLVVAGVSLGLGFYTYKGMRIVVPVLYLISFIYLLIQESSWRRALRPILIYSLALAPLIIVLFFVKKEYPGAIFGAERPQVISSYQQLLLPILSNYDLSFLYLKGDSTPYHSTGRHGVFLISTLPFFLIGVYHSFRQKNGFMLLMVSIIFLSPVLYGLVGAVHRASRLMMIVPSYILLTTFGLYYLYQIIQNSWRRIAFVTLGGLMLVSSADFFGDYWFDYPIRAREHFPSVAHLGYSWLYSNSSSLNLTAYIQGGIESKEGMAGVFFRDVYFPGGLAVWRQEDLPPSTGVILSYGSDFPSLEKAGYKKLELEIPYYVISYKDR